jgi:hypothetical protein
MFNKSKLNNKETILKMVSELSDELKKMGWICKTSFGETGLFIYDENEDPPSNYYPDGLM